MRIGIYGNDPEQVSRLFLLLSTEIEWAAGPALKGAFSFPVYTDIAQAMEVAPVAMIVDCIGDLQLPGVMVVPAEAALHLLGTQGTQRLEPHGAFAAASAQLTASVEKVLQQLDLLTSYSGKLSRVGGQLGAASVGIAEDLERTGRILESITRIAKRSKIIGLNSAIEAARVGDQGRGFAVVAEEIKTLADDSAQSIQGIEKILADIQQRTSEFAAGTSSIRELSDLHLQATSEVAAMLLTLKELGPHLKQLTQGDPALLAQAD